MNGRTKISVEERERAWNNYRKYYQDGMSSSVFVDFYELLGKPYDFTPNAPFYTYPSEAARRVYLLAGPHYYTILKAYEACRSPKSVP